MKYIWKCCCPKAVYVIAAGLGLVIGINCMSGFREFYTGILCNPLIRYLILALGAFLDGQLYSFMTCTAVTIRYRNFERCEIQNMKYQALVLFALMAVIHLPVVILNAKDVVSCLYDVLMIMINGVLVMMLGSSLARLMDLKLHHYGRAVLLTLIAFIAVDRIYEFITDEGVYSEWLGLSQILVLPAAVPLYPVLALVMAAVVFGIRMYALMEKMKYGYCLQNEMDEA